MTLVFPVANGILPRPLGGRISGVFVFAQGGEALLQAGAGREVLVCPWVAEDQAVYPVGVLARIMDIGPQKVTDADGNEMSAVMAVLEGRGHARWHSLQAAGAFVASSDIEPVDLRGMRREYPAVSCAGWLPSGGYTEFRGAADIPVTIYGCDLENGKKASISANLGGLVTFEQAHTLEHGIIRALRAYGLCTPRTLFDSLARETEELKLSLEMGIRFAMPEIIGRTNAGACGNPVTNLARFYLAREFVGNVAGGKSPGRSLSDARRKTMSRLTGDLGLTMERGARALQGLKKGMRHDDTQLKLETYKKIIARFPLDPWS